MNRITFAALAVSALVSGCATSLEATNETAARSPKIEAVTGSRLPRSESFENYQGTKSMTRRDYEEYKASTSLKGGN